MYIYIIHDYKTLVEVTRTKPKNKKVTGGFMKVCLLTPNRVSYAKLKFRIF